MRLRLFAALALVFVSLPRVGNGDTTDTTWAKEKKIWLQTVDRISQFGARFTYIGPGWLCSGTDEVQETVLADVLMNDVAGAARANGESGGIVLHRNDRLTTVNVLRDKQGPLAILVSPQTGPYAGIHCWATITPPLAEPGHIRVTDIVDP